MNKVHPIFDLALSIIAPTYERKPMDRIPERPLQPPHLPHEPLVYDEFDDALFQDICGERLWKPVQDLLQSLRQFETAEKSFGADKVRAFEQILPELKRLKAGFIDAMRDL